MEITDKTEIICLGLYVAHTFNRIGRDVEIQVLYPEILSLCVSYSYKIGFFTALTKTGRLIIGNYTGRIEDVTHAVSEENIDLCTGISLRIKRNYIVVTIRNKIFSIGVSNTNGVLATKLHYSKIFDSVPNVKPGLQLQPELNLRNTSVPDVNIVCNGVQNHLLVRTEGSLYCFKCDGSNQWSDFLIEIPLDGADASAIKHMVYNPPRLYIQLDDGQIFAYHFDRLLLRNDKTRISCAELADVPIKRMIGAEGVLTFFLTDDYQCYVTLTEPINRPVATYNTYRILNYQIVDIYDTKDFVFFKTNDDQIYVERKSVLENQISINCSTVLCLSLTHLAFLDGKDIIRHRYSTDGYYFITAEGRVYLCLHDEDSDVLSFSINLVEAFENNRVYISKSLNTKSALSKLKA